MGAAKPVKGIAKNRSLLLFFRMPGPGATHKVGLYSHYDQIHKGAWCAWNREFTDGSAILQ